jgi:hypothetical protein
VRCRRSVPRPTSSGRPRHPFLFHALLPPRGSREGRDHVASTATDPFHRRRASRGRCRMLSSRIWLVNAVSRSPRSAHSSGQRSAQRSSTTASKVSGSSTRFFGVGEGSISCTAGGSVNASVQEGAQREVVRLCGAGCVRGRKAALRECRTATDPVFWDSRPVSWSG